MRKPNISITRANGTKAMLVSMASLVAFFVASALGGCEGNNKPPMTPDGPEMDIAAAAPPAATVAAPQKTSVPTAATAPSSPPPHRPNPG